MAFWRENMATIRYGRNLPVVVKIITSERSFIITLT
jgi:hypothetical protein